MKYVALCLFALLVGCAAEPVVVTKTVTQYAVLEDSWIADCVITPPPNPVPYNAASLQHRLDMWAKSYAELAKEAVNCNTRLVGARSYNDKKKLEVITTTCTNGVCK